MATRQDRILEVVVQRGKAEVAALADELGVSQVTIRKDLDELVLRRLIRRERGQAVLVSPDDPASRIAYHYAAKKLIAQAVTATIEDGQTVMIEAGSCCALLAEEITGTRRGTTIVTNSAFIAERVRRHPAAHVVLLGGDYQADAQVLVGPMTAQCAGTFHVDRLFIGTDGYTERLGFTGRDQMRVAAVQAMAQRAERVEVLTESEKFGHHGPVALLGADQVAAVWTDTAIPDGYVAALAAAGVTVNRVKEEN